MYTTNYLIEIKYRSVLAVGIIYDTLFNEIIINYEKEALKIMVFVTVEEINICL